jgi:replicative DNA helicase
MTDMDDLLNRASDARNEAHWHASAATPDPWEAPLPLHEGERPEFQREYLPEPLGRFADALATATQTPLALAGMLALAGVSAVAAKTIEIKVRDGWYEPVNIFAIVSLGSANRKSAVVAAISRPHREWEIEQAKCMRVEIAQAKSRRDIAEHRLERLRKDLARDTGGDDNLLRQAEEAELTEQLITDPSLQVPVVPRLLIEDSTHERMAMMMAEQGGRIGVLSAEGDIFQTFAGRYSETKDAGLNLALKAHAGDSMPIDRIGRETRALIAPALTLGLAIQPHVINGLLANANYRGAGLLARFAWAAPESTVGRRQIAPEPVPAMVEQAYADLIHGMLSWPLDQRVVTLSPHAQQALQAFEAGLEPRLGPDGDLEHLADWGGKLAGLVVRVAGLCHAASCQAQGSLPWEHPISADTVSRAIVMAEDFLIPHARTVFAAMGADPAIEQARQVLRVIVTCPNETISRRDLHQRLRRTFPRPEALDRPLEVLVHYGYLRHAPKPTTAGPGRKASPIYEINPLARTQNPRNPQNGLEHRHFEDSEDSVYAPVLQESAATNGLVADILETEWMEVAVL